MMASISKQPNGRRTIQFMAPDGKRKSIRLGKCSQRSAESIKVRVEHLAAAAIGRHAVDDETSRWVVGLDDVLAGKLARVGLIPERQSQRLHEYLTGYIDSRTDAATNTVNNFRTLRRSLVLFFGEDRNLRSITPGDADDWRQWIVQQHAEATVSKLVKRAKQVFRLAARKQLVSADPFADLRGGSERNESRLVFVPRDITQQVLGRRPRSPVEADHRVGSLWGHANT